MPHSQPNQEGDAMKRFLVCVLCSVFLLPSPASAENMGDHIFKVLQGFPDGVVPDETAALGVVEALIRGRYGEEMLKQNQPLTVRRDGEFWVVSGKERKPTPLITTVRISKADARVDLFMVISDDGQHLFESIQRPNKDDCHASCHMLQEKK